MKGRSVKGRRSGAGEVPARASDCYGAKSESAQATSSQAVEISPDFIGIFWIASTTRGDSRHGCIRSSGKIYSQLPITATRSTPVATGVSAQDLGGDK